MHKDNVIDFSSHLKMRKRIISDAACAEVAATISTRQSATETRAAMVKRIVAAYLAAEAQP